MMLRRAIAFLAFLALGSINAQAATRAFPSLAKRPVETMDRPADAAQAQSTTAASAATPAKADPALADSVEALRRDALKGDAAFKAALDKGRETVTAAVNTAPMSEPWVAAQLMISSADATRYESVSALASLDSLHIDHLNRADSARIAADMALIEPARAEVLAMVDEQNDALDMLKGQLARP